MSRSGRDQGGAATSEPSRLRRFIVSRMMSRLADPVRRDRARARAESRRRAAGEPHRVEYFHQPDDPYSELAVQLLAQLCSTYDIELVCHLVSADRGASTPEPGLLADYARRDAAAVAPHYGLRFPAAASQPEPARLALATRILAGLADRDFPVAAREVGAALWQGNDAALQALAVRLGEASADVTAARVEAGTLRRRQAGHYSGAMFLYGGEWYWGVDRLYHLEHRLIALGARRVGGSELIAPRPLAELPAGLDAAGLTLEFYVSLRSPYTSIIYYKTMGFARACGLKLVVRPVLPMVMRGVSLSREKGLYISFDTAREAETLGLVWGKVRDPIGEPVRRVYSLLPWARSRGRAETLLGAALQACFFSGIDLGSERGLRFALTAAGLPWLEAKAHLGKPGWEAECERNRAAMYEAGLWGVPAYRLIDASGHERLSVWGQDRLWLIQREVVRLAGGAG